MASLGDVIYRGSSVWKRLVGNTTTTRKFLRQTGDGANSAAPAWDQVTDADLSTSDVTTNDVSTTKHGFAPKAPNDATKFLDGTGAWTVPAGSGGGALDDLTDVTITSPSTNDVLKYNGSAWVNGTVAGSTGALVLLEQHTASGSASLDFTSWYSASYDVYQIQIVGVVPATATVSIRIQVSTDGGATYITTSSYKWSRSFEPIVGGGTSGTSANQTTVGFPLWETDHTNTATNGIVGSGTLYAPGSTSLYKNFIWDVIGSTSSITYHIKWAGVYQSTSAVNAFRVIASSGNLASGTVRVYGIGS